MKRLVQVSVATTIGVLVSSCHGLVVPKTHHNRASFSPTRQPKVPGGSLRPNVSRKHFQSILQFSSSSSKEDNKNDKKNDNDHAAGWRAGVAAVFSAISQTANVQRNFKPLKSDRERRNVQLRTLLRVSIPSILSGLMATAVFPAAALYLASGPVVGTGASAAGSLAVLANDSGQFVQNFQTVASLLFSILVGQTCTS